MEDVIQRMEEFAALQRALCIQLRESFPFEDIRSLTDLPKRGSISLDDSYWEFQRHGSGISFIRVPEGDVVDAHAELVAQPSGIDACRLAQYFESKGIGQFEYDSKQYNATDERSIKSMLEYMHEKGRLESVVPERRIYTLK